MRAFPILSLLLLDCAAEPRSTESTGPTESVWPQRVTLVTTGAGVGSDSVQFADAAIIAGDGDLRLHQAMVLSIRSPTPESVCEKGKFAALDDIPTDLDACPAALSGTWGTAAYLDAATLHTSDESYAAGLGFLVRDRDHTALYRLRVVGDSYDAQGRSTVTFDYEPVPN